MSSFKASLQSNFSFSYIIFFIFLYVYQALSSVFLYLPLLLGLFFCYMILLLEQKDGAFLKLDFRWYLCLGYLFCVEITHDFFIFSLLLSFVCFYYLCVGQIRLKFKIGKFLPILFIFFAYVFVCVIDLFCAYIFGQNAKDVGVQYFSSIIIESLLAFLLFRGKF